MPGCLELFCEGGLSGTSLQIRVDCEFPGFACERECCSPFSPGPVADDEQLAFLLINPTHYDEERRVVVPNAFRELTTRDLSTIRLAHATKEEVVETRGELVERGLARSQDRVIEEVCVGRVAELRAPLNQEGRILGVFDTALERKPAHASVFTTAACLKDPHKRKLLRERVHSVMTQRLVPLAEALEGLPERGQAGES